MIMRHPGSKLRFADRSPTRPLSVQLLRDTIARLYLAAEAMNVSIDDIDPSEFAEEEQQRWRALADDYLRRFINEEPKP